MESLFPIEENSLRPLFGRAVCVIMNDGLRHTGILTSCTPSSIVLNGERTGRPVNRTRKSKVTADISTLQQEDQSPSTTYWGMMSLAPALEISTIKAVIPLAPIRDMYPI